jgi:hypothetical protein
MHCTHCDTDNPEHARFCLNCGARLLAVCPQCKATLQLEAHTLDGTYEPFRIRLTCYQVLRANEDARAEQVLGTAYQLLQERAAGIEDENLWHSFLEKVPAHRELVHEAERAGVGS